MRTDISLLAAILLAATGVAQEGGSTFGHARTRAMAELGRLPSPAEVAVADLVNFHRHRLPLPRAGEPVAFDLRAGAPGFARGGTAVLQFGFTSAPVADRADLGPVHLALAIDRSGSMAAAGKLDVVKDALRTLVGRLRPDDHVTLVGWSDTAEVLGSARRGNGGELRAAIERLQPGGSTNLHAGLVTALDAVADRAAGRARILLLTDGIANRGLVHPDGILADVLERAGRDIDITTIGFGTDLNVELLDRLARGARGTFHFVADPQDVAKVFVDEFESQIATVARNLELTVELPEGVELVRVFGHEVVDGRIRLPHLNVAATQVVMAVCRLAPGSGAELPRTVRASLSYDLPAGGARECRGAQVELAPPAAVDRLADAEVRKNFVIARVAAGMHRMAELAREQRWVDADRELADALRMAQRRFPNGDEADVARVVEMAKGFRGVLQRYVERFRDA